MFLGFISIHNKSLIESETGYKYMKGNYAHSNKESKDCIPKQFVL